MRDRSPEAKGLFLLLHLEAGCDRNSARRTQNCPMGFSGWEERGHRHHSLDKLQKHFLRSFVLLSLRPDAEAREDWNGLIFSCLLHALLPTSITTTNAAGAKAPRHPDGSCFPQGWACSSFISLPSLRIL